MKAKREACCPVEKTMLIVGKRWTPLIIRDLVSGKKRFGELAQSLGGISPKTLSQRLSELEEWGIVNREIFAEVPVRVEYSLTEKGLGLRRIIDTMADWGNQWLMDKNEPRRP